MKKSTNIIASASLLTIMVLSLGAAFVISNNKVETPAFATYTNGDAATYYNSIDSTQSGNTLLTALRTLNLSKRKSTVGYSSMGTTPSGQFKYTDYDPDYVQYDSNGQPYGTQISSFYTYTSTTSWNREHVWPNSHGGGEKGDVESPYADADIHMPRPTISSENSSRGNSFFVEGMNHSANGWDPYTAGYDANSRGEAARITFYCTLVNAKLILAPNNTTPSGTDSVTGQSFGSGHTMGNLETLIKWNINYPVNQREKNRNEGAEYLQGNRNPFVDHPEYACKIWGNVNNNIKTMCDNASWDTGPSVTLSKSSTSLTVDDTTTINATSSDGSTITWKSNDTTVVEVSSSSSASGANVTLTAVGAGTTTVTAKATINSTVYSATCSVTVTSSGSGGGGGDTPADGYTITTSDVADGSYPTTDTSYTSADGLSFTANNVAKFSGKIQFKKSGGYLYNNNSLNLSTLTISGVSGALTVYAGTSKNPSSTAITGSNGSYDLSGYNYFKIINSSSSVATCSSISVGVSSSGGTEKTLSSIAVSTAPSKTSYTAGEYFDPTGLVITRNYSDSTSDTYTYAGHTSEFSFTPSTSTALTTSNTSVTISYGGKSCSQAITVTAASKTLSSISISGSYKTSFTVGDTFSFGGTVTANFSDSTTQDVTGSATFNGYNMSSTGNQTVTVSYTYGGTTKTTSYSITVASSGGSSSETTYNLVTDGLSVGDKVVIVAQANRTATTGYALTSTLVSQYYFSPTEATMSNQKLTLTSSMAVWTVGSYSGGYSFYSSTQSKYIYGYTTTSNNKTYRDLGLTSSTGNGVGWTVEENSDGTGYDVHTKYSSNDIYLEYYSSKGSFSAYSASATDYVLNFYRETSSSVGETAATWGTAFLSTISCDATGTNAPSTSAWATMKSQYEALSGAEKTNVTSATPSESGTDLQKAIARYVYIVNKYTNRTNYPDYLGKASGTNSINPLSTNDTTMIIFVVLSASIIISSGLVIYHLSRKKKEF